MKILVTGGAGFIGSAVTRRALALGHQVINLDALTYAANPITLAQLNAHPNHHFEKASILDQPRLEGIFFRHKPDAVMHLAAESHVDRSIRGPEIFMQTNVLGTQNLLEAARHYWCECGQNSNFRFLHVSTDEVFGSLDLHSKNRFTEATPYAPRSPYAASKAASDHLVRAWHETYGLPTLITNCSNNYGPYQFPEKLVPLALTNALEGKAIPIYGNGQNRRDWLHVDDHAKALFTVLTKGRVGESYVIGGEAECSNIELVHQICRILNRLIPKSRPYCDQIKFVEDRPGHDLRYAIDPRHIRTALGWRPTQSLQTGLQQTLQWYLANEAWWKPGGRARSSAQGQRSCEKLGRVA